MAVTASERKRILDGLRRDAELHQRMVADYTSPRATNKRELEARIEEAEAWLTTLERVHKALCAQPSPEWDGEDWNQRHAVEKARAQQTERSVQLIMKILKQEEYVAQLKRAYERLYTT
jgi:hypothetical protein